MTWKRPNGIPATHLRQNELCFPLPVHFGNVLDHLRVDLWWRGAVTSLRIAPLSLIVSNQAVTEVLQICPARTTSTLRMADLARSIGMISAIILVETEGAAVFILCCRRCALVLPMRTGHIWQRHIRHVHARWQGSNLIISSFTPMRHYLFILVTFIFIEILNRSISHE